MAILTRFGLMKRKADAHKEGFLYNLGTNLFPLLGKVAEETLELLGEKEFVDAAYSDTTISVEKFKELKGKELAINGQC